MNNKNSAGAIYIRDTVGLEDMAQEFMSKQEQVCRQSATRHNIDIKHAFTDKGDSGVTIKRPGLSAAMDWCKHNKNGVLLVASIDRLTRSSAHLFELNKLLGKSNTELIAVGTEGDGNPDNHIPEYLESILAQMAAYDRYVMSQKAKAAWARRKARQ